MAKGRFISYLRVSTDRQGKSGLGLSAQRSAVETYLNGGEWQLVAEVVEVESGKRADRPKLAEAIALCKAHGAKLVIAKLDRLSRNASFLLNLKDAGVEFVAADMPEANRLTVGIMALVAEQEREAISQRTKAALAEAKKRGVQLGAYRDGEFVGRTGTAEDMAKARDAKAQQADQRAQELHYIIDRINAESEKPLSLSAMARRLNDDGIPTPSGKGKWQAVTVQRLLNRVG